MKKHIPYITLAALALSAVACTQQEEFEPQGASDEVKISATIATELKSRVSDDGASFTQNDAIKVTNLTRTADKNVATYTYNDSKWEKTSGLLCWQGAADTENHFQAVYPATEEYGSFTVADQTGGLIDWMTAEATASKGENADNTVDFTFAHRLAKVTVTVGKWNDEFSDETQQKLNKAEIRSLATTVAWDGSELSTTENAEKWIQALMAEGGQSFSAIICPGNYNSGDEFLQVYVNESATPLSVKIKSETGIELVAGTHYTFTLNVGKEAATINGISVTDWTDDIISGGEAEEIPPYVTFSAESEQTFKIYSMSSYTLDPSMEYSVGEGEWAALGLSTKIFFGGNKGNLRLRGRSATGTATSTSSFAQIEFGNKEVKVACSGDIRTLVDYTDYTNANTSNARFCQLFRDCKSLTSAPELPATTLADNCYNAMFNQCEALVNAPALPATTLADNCYNTMFGACSSLETAPELSATTLTESCYKYMFRDCTSLNNAPALPATTLTDNCYNAMFKGCTSLNNAPALPATTLTDNCYNAMFKECTSLNNAPALPATTLAENCYEYMFQNCTSLTNAPVLPATTLTKNCYRYMFQNCTSLETAPALPAETLAESCYEYMFYGCTSLTNAPALPATTLAKNCYYFMFQECTSLETAPALPAETLAENCYRYMFYKCTALTNAPTLCAQTLTNGCYYAMFYQCSNLSSVTMLATSGLENDNLSRWLNETASTGTLYVADESMKTWFTNNASSYNPNNWTVTVKPNENVTE